MKRLVLTLGLVSSLAMAGESKNRARLLIGRGPDGVKVSTQANTVVMSPKQALVFGFGYDRYINSELSLGIQMLSNKTALGSIGIGF